MLLTVNRDTSVFCFGVLDSCVQNTNFFLLCWLQPQERRWTCRANSG